MPGTTCGPLFITHHPRQRWKNLQPVGRVVPRLDKAAQCLQRAQALCALPGTEQMLTQLGIEARQMREHAPVLGQLRREAIEEFVLQIIQQRIDPLLRLITLRPVTLLQQRHAHPGAPTAGTLDDTCSNTASLLGRQMSQRLGDFVRGQGQRRGFAFVQFVVEQQPRPVALRPSAGADPPGERRTTDRQQTVEQRIQRWIRQPTVVIDKQPGRQRPATQRSHQAGLRCVCQSQRPCQSQTKFVDPHCGTRQR